MIGNFRAFTNAYKGRTDILKSEVAVGAAFDPADSAPSTTVSFEAIWDTGATGSVISQSVVQKCSLKPTGQVQVHTASGEATCNTYLVSIALPNDVGFPALRVTEGILYGTDVLIGMDIIGAGDFSVSNFRGTTTFTYRFPSVAKTDFVQEANRLKEATRGKVGRNSPCPCGSGMKYKKCCGK